MASVTCGLTAEDWNQLRDHTLVSSMDYLLLIHLLTYNQRPHHGTTEYRVILNGTYRGAESLVPHNTNCVMHNRHRPLKIKVLSVIDLASGRSSLFKPPT